MKRLFCMLLIFALACLGLSGCDRRSTAPESKVEANFAPEATVAGGLMQAVEEQENSAPEYVEPEPVQPTDAPAEEDMGEVQEVVEDQPITQDKPADEQDGEAEDGASEEEPDPMPFATPAPQANASVSEYTEVSAPGLGFRFSHPTGWTNIPGRSTVCYVQPIEEGTDYPARVTVSMKRMVHTTDMDEVQTELANFLKTLMTQYDESTFKVDKDLDTRTKFMGNRAVATTYLAYDGEQEIKGYTIATHFERYVYVFHFLCAYDDYPAFEPAMRHMRDSVLTDASVAPK